MHFFRNITNKVNKILQDNNVLFYPFILNKVRNKDVFLGECMDFIMNDAVKYKLFIDRILTYKGKFSKKVFNNFDFVCRQLIQIEGNYFKDEEKKLILSISDGNLD